MMSSHVQEQLVVLDERDRIVRQARELILTSTQFLNPQEHEEDILRLQALNRLNLADPEDVRLLLAGFILSLEYALKDDRFEVCESLSQMKLLSKRLSNLSELSVQAVA